MGMPSCICDGGCYTVNCPCNVSCNGYSPCACDYSCYDYGKYCSCYVGYGAAGCTCNSSAYFTTCNCNSQKYAPDVWLFYCFPAMDLFEKGIVKLLKKLREKHVR